MRRKYRPNRNIYRFYIIVCILLTILVMLFINVFKYNNINRRVIIEAGMELPNASVFLKDSTKQAKYISDTSTVKMNEIGVYDLKIESGGAKYNVKLEVRDTIPPSAELKTVDLYESRPVEPQEFIKQINDGTNVKVSFKTNPDLNRTGNQEVILLLEDSAGNKTELKGKLRISKVKELVKVDMVKREVNLESFLKEKSDLSSASLVEPLEIPGVMGIYPAKVKIGDTVYESSIQVTDLVPPKAAAVNQTIWQNDTIDASMFVKDIEDATKVTVSYAQQPDFSKPGDQVVQVRLTDEGNNETIIEAVLTVQQDTEPPAIYGVKDNTIYINTPVSFKKDVFAYDNRDGEIEIQVDSSQVNQNKEGQYKVIFIATDSSGNTSRKEAIYTVKQPTVTMEELNRLADEILARITTPDMTLREKAWEIYQYINKHITYTNYSDKTDWMKEAYNGIINGVGDCFTYFSMSELLLNRIGIKTMRVERLTKPGENKHYWHLVNYGEGWYHFDACIHRPPLVSFMLTDAELDAYSAKTRDNYYYRFDRDNYPRTPEK